ncbi:MAG: response regulator [Spirochaetota bacterium]|nr:response regulator [Spirochaetota bacterium]
MIKKRVLTVDDNKEFCHNLSDILEMKEFEVECAYNGHEALKMTESNNYDIVLMDVKMPKMNGVDTFKKLKEFYPKVPVIMMTAFAVEDMIKEALTEGAFGVLRKPIDFEKLFTLIELSQNNEPFIMIVDDDKEFCSNLYDIFSEKEYLVYTAKDGETAIHNVQEQKFDIIILDLMLPTLNGLETYRIIRKYRPDVIVIAITGYPMEMKTISEKIINENVYLYLEKPLNMINFTNIIDNIIKKEVQ